VARTLIAPVRDQLAGAETLENLVDMTLRCVRILAHPGLDERPKLHADLAAILREHGERLRPGDLETWRAEVERRLKPERRQEWDAIFSHEPPKQGGRKQAINLWRTRS
jgi:hypothetical protein